MDFVWGEKKLVVFKDLEKIIKETDFEKLVGEYKMHEGVTYMLVIDFLKGVYEIDVYKQITDKVFIVDFDTNTEWSGNFKSFCRKISSECVGEVYEIWGENLRNIESVMNSFRNHYKAYKVVGNVAGDIKCFKYDIDIEGIDKKVIPDIEEQIREHLFHRLVYNIRLNL